MKPTRFLTLFGRTTRLMCLGLLAGGLTSCAHSKVDAARDPFLKTAPLVPSDDFHDTGIKPATGQGSAKSIAGIPLPVDTSEGPVVANHMQVREVKAPAPAPPSAKGGIITPTAGQVEISPPSGLPAEWCPPQTHFPAAQHPVEMCPPGYPAAGMLPFPGEYPAGGMLPFPPVVPAWIGGAAIAPVPAHFPDEYLCDGGDRGYPVRYDANMRLGLDTEDTVAEYTDHTGDTHVKPTNKVCVYAPRFGAMRTVSSPILDTSVDKIASADKFIHGAGMRNRDAYGLHRQNTAVGKYRTRERASDIDVMAHLAGVGQTDVLAGYQNVQNTFEDLQFIRSGLLVQTDEVRLARGLQAAVNWTRNEYPIVAAQIDQAQEVQAEFHAQEFIGRKDNLKPGRLRIVKLADKAVAQPGDIITFTIRYDNLGDLPLSAIRVIDNLTPRLQYVEDSETSDRAGRLVLQDNEEGSLILEFQLDEPLPGKQGGVVTFQARVR